MNKYQLQVVYKQTFPLKPYTPGQLSEMYGITRKTLNNWIRPFKSELGKRIGRYYSIPQIKIIIIHLGIPSLVEETTAKTGDE